MTAENPIRNSRTMLQQFTSQELASFNRTQLWQLCKERGLKCYPKSADCVEAIWNKQQSVVHVAVAEVKADEQTICQEFEITTQTASCASCPLFKPFNDGTGRGLCCGVADTSLVVRDHHTLTQDCQNLIDEQANIEAAPTVVAPTVQIPVVQSGSLTFKKAASASPKKTVYEVFRGTDSLGLVIKSECGCWYNSDSDDYVDGYVTPYEAIYSALVGSANLDLPTTVVREIEIDSDTDPDFGIMYRVWGGSIGINLLGTFYRATDEKWIAQPCNSKDKPRCNTAEEAQFLIMAMSGSLVADSPKDFIDLLDKPFDELTVADWEAIKRDAQQAEMIAA